MTKTLLTSASALSFMALVAIFSGCAQTDTHTEVPVGAPSQTTTTQAAVTTSDSEVVQDDVMDADTDTKTAGAVSTDDTIFYNPDGSIDTSNWQTYTNEEYGFSVKYPENGLFVGIQEDVQHRVAFCFSNDGCAIYPDGEAWIYIKQDCVGRCQQEWRASQERATEVYKSETVTIAGKEMIVKRYASPDFGNTEYIISGYVCANDICYHLVATSLNIDENKIIFDAFVKSFRIH